MDTEDVLIQLDDIRKSFRGVRALRGVSLTVERGETLALVGPNGAGKSTLVNVIAGVLQPDEGTVRLAGERVSFSDPKHAKRQGIIVVPQELQAFPRMSTAANLSAGLVVRRRSWFVNSRRDRDLLNEICERLGLSLRNERQFGLASAEAQRLIMVGQAVLEGARVLILDEPTAGLSPEGCEAIYEALETTRSPDMAVIYVTHKFDEVERMCDRAAVVVDGLLTRTLEKKELSRQTLSTLVSGGAVGGASERGDRRPRSARSTSRTPPVVVRGGGSDAAWEVSCPRGSVTALAGLADSGVEDVVRGVTGRSGATVELIDGETVLRLATPRAAMLAGVSYVGGRRGQSSFLGMSISTNVVLGKVRLGRSGLVLNRRKERRLASTALTGVQLGATDANRALGTLSGGNQQRALFARLTFAGGRLLVVDDPTVGVDVGGRDRIHELIYQAVEEGYAVLLYSSDPEECVDLADEIHVFVGGKVVSRLVSPVTTVQLVLEMSRSSARARSTGNGLVEPGLSVHGR